MNKNYTLNGLVDFKNKQWYTTESVIVNLYDEVELNYVGKIKVNGLHEAIKDLETTYHKEIEYNKLIVTEHKDLNLIHYKYYVKHYNENYLTLVTTEFKLDEKYKIFESELEKVLKNIAWAYYTELLMNENIVATYSNPATRIEFEKLVESWKKDSCWDIWEKQGVPEQRFEHFEPELKFLQDEFEEKIKKEIEFEKSLVTAYVDFYEDDCMIQEMSIGEFRKFYKGVRNRTDGHLTMLFDDGLKNMTYCTGLRLYVKSNGDLKRVKIKDYL